MALFTAETPEQVRNALDLSLDANALPDSVIGSRIYAADAESELLRRDPNAAAYAEGSTALTNARTALAYLIAARIAPALPAITSEQLGDYRYQLAATDVEKSVARLRGLANAAVAANVNPDGLRSVPGMFCAAAGRRGR